MTTRFLFVALSLILGLQPVSAEQADPVVIDDLTVLRAGRTVQLERPLEGFGGPVGAPEQAKTATGSHALGEGYAVCSTSDDAYPFDLSAHTAGSGIVLPGSINYPYDATMRPDGSEVWVADASDDSVLVIDMASDTVAHQIPVCTYAVSLAFAKDQSFAVVSCRDDTASVDNIYLVSTSTYGVVGSWIGPQDYLGPGNIALDPVSGNFYMVQWYDNFLHELPPDGGSVARTVSLGSSLWQLVVDPDGSVVYVTDRGTDQVRVIDRASLTELNAVTVGDDPWGIDVTPDGSKLFVACEDSSNVYAVDTSTWATTAIALGASDPRDVDISPDGASAFVAGGDSGATDYVFVIDVASNALIGSVPLTSGASNVNVVAAASQPVPVELLSLSVE